MAQFPHCDSRIVHRPLTCIYCDMHPELQQKRIDEGINFTGEHDTSKRMCPAEAARPLDIINRWGGNTPKEENMDIHVVISHEDDLQIDTPLIEWVKSS